MELLLLGHYLIARDLLGGANEVPKADGSAGWSWSVAPAGDISFSDLTDYTAPDTTTGTSIANLAVTNDKIDFSSGVSLASAVTKFGVFSISNPQDWGGGSASSPFRIGSFPAFLYPDGVFIIYLEVRNTGSFVGSNDITGLFSQWSSGTSITILDTPLVTTTNALVSVDLSGISGPVIEAGNELFFESTSGVSEMTGGYAFFPR